MHIADAGGGGSVTNTAPPACVVSDSKVKGAVEQTVAATQFGQQTDGAQAAYQIQQTLARSDLTQDQKDEYLAAIVQMAGGQSTFCGSVDERTSDKLLNGLNDIGTAWTDPATPELRDQVTDGIARGVADGRLDADDLYGLVSEPAGAGARQLLTDVRDGTALASVANRLVDDARAQGYDINDHQTGPQTLTAAADIANMAAAGGNRSAANAVLAEITRVETKGPVAGKDMTLTQAMMATTVGGGQWNNLYARDGFHALSGLLNSSTQNAANQPAQDKLFADLVALRRRRLCRRPRRGRRSQARARPTRHLFRSQRRPPRRDRLADGQYRRPSPRPDPGFHAQRHARSRLWPRRTIAGGAQQ